MALLFAALTLSSAAGAASSRSQQSLDECRKNYLAPPFDSPPKCFARFVRDTAPRYYCSDGGCALSEALNRKLSGGGGPDPCDDPPPEGWDGTFSSPAFVEIGGEPEPIECGRVTYHQEGCGTPCGDPPEDTPINEEIRNYLYADFHAPMYQSLSCCSSIARFGFSYDASIGVQGVDGNDPFARSPLIVGCQVQRRSISGNTCDFDFESCDGADCWSSFSGVGACGVAPLSPHDSPSTRMYPSLPDLGSGLYDAGIEVLNGMPNLTVHPYCRRGSVLSECEATRDQWEGFDADPSDGVSCSGSDGSCDNSRLDFSSKCRYSSGCDAFARSAEMSTVTPTAGGRFPAPMMSNPQKAGCQRCGDLMRALHAFPCSGWQGDFVKKDEGDGATFRICSSACDRLYEACGNPTHRGGMFVQALFMYDGSEDDPTPRFAADYDDPVSMCMGLWAPHPDSFWARENVRLEVVPDSEGSCVTYERSLGSFSFDTQNFIFDYEAIFDREGYCSTRDPLFDPENPCGDFEEEAFANVDERVRNLGEVSEKKSAMWAKDDVQRAKEIQNGWPYEEKGVSRGAMIGIIAGSVVGGLVVVGMAAIYTRKKKASN